MNVITKEKEMPNGIEERVIRIETKLSKAFEAMGIDLNAVTKPAMRSMRIVEGDKGKDFIEVAHLEISLLSLQKFCAYEGIHDPIRIEFHDATIGMFYPRSDSAST